jgi:elongation factor Ts
MAVTAEQIKKLRELTGAGILDAKNTLEKLGDFDKAVEELRAKGISRADKKADRVAREGLVESYIHLGGRIGVLVEVNCETDFVARTDDFKSLTHEVALQIAGTNPKYVSPEDIPSDVLQAARAEFESEARKSGKPEPVVTKITEGKLAKYYQEVCLTYQPSIRDESTTVNDLIKNTIAKTGENIRIRRFARFELGE